MQNAVTAKISKIAEKISPQNSSAVSLPLSQPGTGNNLKEPKQAGWTFSFRA
jgi:hypothetical protein